MMQNGASHPSQPPGATGREVKVGHDPSVAGPTPSRGAGPARPIWYRLYFLLAAFDLLTVSFSLYLNHRLMRIHDESVRVNQEWAERLNRFSDLAQLGGEANAPGNDVFDTRDVPAESADMRAALARFNPALAAAAAELGSNVAPAHAALLLRDLADVRQAMMEMVNEAELIFSCFRNSQPDKAGERMATMDRKYARLNAGFAGLGRHVRQIQAENFRAQQAQSAMLRRFEFAIAAAIVVMILSVTFYGHRMARAMSAIADEKERYFEALRQARDELETRVAERTGDLQQANTELLDEISRREKVQRELASAHRELLDASRHAGMAEVATGVLHNVGNVLNSVNVSATLLTDSLKKSKAANLGKAVALMREHATDLGGFLTGDPKGKQLPGYLGQLAEHLVAEQGVILNEVESLRKNIEHIKEIVAMQQSYAKVSGVAEFIKVTDLVEDTLRMNVESLSKCGVEVVRQFEDVPAITVDKHKLLQILVNLVRNAKHACADAGRADKRITLRVTGDAGHVRISVSDNGVGIPPENLNRIFNHGFTTKKDGHGFGLHSGANAAKEMGGSLSVHSDGAGRGSTFTVELPWHSKAVTTPLNSRKRETQSRQSLNPNQSRAA